MVPFHKLCSTCFLSYRLTLLHFKNNPRLTISMYFYCFPSTDHHISFFYYTEKQFTYLCPKIFFSLFQVFIFRRNWWCFRHIQELLFPGISREDLPSVQGYSLQQLASCFSNKHQGINRKRNVLVSG